MPANRHPGCLRSPTRAKASLGDPPQCPNPGGRGHDRHLPGVFLGGLPSRTSSTPGAEPGSGRTPPRQLPSRWPHEPVVFGAGGRWGRRGTSLSAEPLPPPSTFAHPRSGHRQPVRVLEAADTAGQADGRLVAFPSAHPTPTMRAESLSSEEGEDPTSIVAAAAAFRFPTDALRGARGREHGSCFAGPYRTDRPTSCASTQRGPVPSGQAGGQRPDSRRVSNNRRVLPARLREHKQHSV